MNFDVLVMQLLQAGRQANQSYTLDNAIADATKVKLAYDSMVTLRASARTVARSGQGVIGRGGVRGGVIGLGSSSANGGAGE